MLIGVMVPLWTAKNVTSWHLPFWERDPLRKNGNSFPIYVSIHNIPSTLPFLAHHEKGYAPSSVP